MSNQIQIKRSVANAVVTGLANGELAFTQNSNVLYVGAPDGTSGSLAIGGLRTPGTLTANQALVANSTSGIDKVIVANLVPTQVYANGGVGSTGQLLASAGSGNVYWVDAGTLTTQPAGANTQVQYNNSNTLGASASFTFNSTTNTLTVTNISGNGAGVTSVNAVTVGGNSVSDLHTYSDNKAANAYSNATSYADTAAATAYSNATSYADTKAATAYSNATSYADTKAATAYSNATAYADNKAANAYSNATSYADNKAANAYSNATSYADNKAANAYTNAVAYANLTFQTMAGLNANIASYLIDGTNKVITGNTITLNGNVVVNGNTEYFVSNNVVYADALIELHAPGANVANTWTFDDGKDIGIRFHYYNSGDKNAALVLADDTKYLEWYIDGTESGNGVFSGTYGDIKANNFLGTATSANNASYLSGNTVSDLHTYSDNKAANAYSNATSYADTKAATAYSNATSYADTKAATAYSNATSYADTAAATAYSNATSYADNKAANAYSNATAFASNATNISSGTLNTARLPATANISTAVNVGANVNLSTSQINVGNATVNTVITSTSITTTNISGNGANITSVNAATVGGNTASDLRTYADNKAANAYSNATSYADTKAATAYSNATSYADTKAATAYSNATSYADTKAATAYSNATSYADNKAANAYSNAMSDTLSRSGTYTGNNTFQGTTTVIQGTLTTIDSNVSISSTTVNAPNATLSIKDIVASGNLTINGTLTTVNTNNLIVKDNIIKLADDQANSATYTDAVDVGFYSEYGNTANTYYTGFFRDHAVSTTEYSIFKLFHTHTEPGSTVNTADATYKSGKLVAWLGTPGNGVDGFNANSTLITLTANSTQAVQITANTLSLSTALPATSGGTGLASYTAGDILYASNTSSLSKLGIAANGQVLQVVNNIPAWGTLDGGTF